MSKTLDRYPYYRINDWDEHQPREASGSSPFIRNYTALLINPKYRSLSGAARGVLHGLWLVRGWSGTNPPRAPVLVRSSLGLAHDKHLSRTLKTLEERGFLIPTKNKVPPKRRVKERRVKESTPAAFGQWYQSYPKKVGRPAALRAWQAAKNRPATEVLIAAVKRQAASEQWQKDGGRFIPNPATWLNQGRWGDQGTKLPGMAEVTEAEIAEELKRG